MANGKDWVGTLIKGVVVLGLGAALGGYIVYMFQSSPPPPGQRAGEDPSAITPGSDSKSPKVASNEQPESSPTMTTPDASTDPDNNPQGDVTSSPDGQTGPDVDITVKPVTAAQTAEGALPGTAAKPAEPRHRRRRRPAVLKPKVEPELPEKPPAETFLPDQGDGGGSAGATTGGGTTGGGTTGGAGGGTDGGRGTTGADGG